VKDDGWGYLKVWNMIDWSYLIPCPLFIYYKETGKCRIEGDGLNDDPECISRLNVLAAFAVFILYMKLFYYMRINRDFTTFIRMISEMVREVSTFAIMLFLVLAGFGNILLVLSFNRDPTTHDDDLFSDFVGVGPINALLHSWLTGLGEFGFDNFSTTNAGTTWFMFFLATIVIQIIYMNLLVAIMSEAYAKFSDDDNVESSTLKAICQMMEEHDFLVKAEEEFVGARYILHLGANSP
jgi:hypothetical protein